jgi:predicted 3-demethylubiquinone-9 3-methyltransferase (glyoxalase superfamily)
MTSHEGATLPDVRGAIGFYVALFPGAAAGEIERFGARQPGKEALVMRASFTVGGLTVLCNDSPVKHAFTFTPANSLFVDCDSEAELDRIAAGLGAQFLMPPGNYGFSRKFAWINDRFGVSWQINLP